MSVSAIIASAPMLLVASLALADDPEVPAGAKPLSEAEIKAVLGGRTFSFTAYDEPLTGTSSWDARSGSVSGSYVWNQTEKGTYEQRWFVAGGKNCTQSPDKEAVCQNVYRHGDGFMEVTDKGIVHSVSVPKAE